MRVELLKQNYDKNTKINALKTDTPPPLNKKNPKTQQPKILQNKKKCGDCLYFFFLNLLHLRNGA